MPRLGDVAEGRDNNLNAIRLCAALAVLVSHAWPITGGPGTIEPLQVLTGTTLGTYAVMVFFGLSGFLITASFQRDPNPRRFCLRRARRLFPGLILCLGLTVFCLGPMVSDLSILAYLSDESLWSFLLINGLMIGFQGDLPGVFQGNPYPAAAGSIWTLQYEVMCYGAVLVAGCLGLLGAKKRALLTFTVGITAAAIMLAFQEHLPTRLIRLSEFAIPFAFGGVAWIWRDRIPLNAGALIGLCLAAVLAHGTVVQPIFEPLAITYATLLIGFVGGPSMSVRLPGDYSYGIYIYAFPVQGLIIHVFGTMDPWMNVLLATPVTVCLAAASWHWVERPSLRRQSGSASRLKTMGTISPRAPG
ncbi:MAG: acyltransferase [Pseudomonadota bacterium]